MQDPAARLNLPWAQPAGRVHKLGPIWFGGTIQKQCDSVAKHIFSRVAMATPSTHGTHALLFTHDWPLHSLHQTVKRRPCQQPATWLMFTIREEHWRVPGIKAIVTPFELDANWSRGFYPRTGKGGDVVAAPRFPAFATRKSAIMWRGAKKVGRPGLSVPAPPCHRHVPTARTHRITIARDLADGIPARL